MLGGCEGGGGWGDGPRPPGVPTGLPCQAPVAAFIIANVLSMTLTIDACRLVGTVQTSCLYWHPEHLPSKPKLTQAPSRPTLNWLKHTLPLLHSSTMDMPGWSLLKVATTFWHIGGIAALTVGCGPVTRAARGVDGVVGTGTLTGGPRNMASGHVIVTWIAQSSTSCQTVFPKLEWGSCWLSSHRSHAKKN